MDKKLTIKNLHKIWGRQVYSTWIPGTYGWAIGSVEEISDNYYFQLASNGPLKSIQIKLRRNPAKYNPDDREFLYELWAWSHSNGKWVEEYYPKKDLDTMDGMCMRLGLMLEKILPKG
jgi:hypothetical protein